MWKRAFVFSSFSLLSEATSWNFTPPVAEQQKCSGTAGKAGLKAEKIGQNLKKKGLIHPTSPRGWWLQSWLGNPELFWV